MPVSATDSGGKPLYCLDDPARAPIPYLECAPNTITSKMVEVILQSRTQRPHLLACYRNTMSAALKAMAVQRRGLTWLPECAVVDEIHSGQLALAGTEAWMLTMDLRIYRNRKTGTDDKEKIWHYCLQGREMPVEP